MKVFVRTGPGFDNCRTAIPVEVDLIESGTDSMFPTFSHNTSTWFVTICSNYQRTIGFQNSPRELSINRRQITVSTSSGQRHIYAIEIFYLLRGKLTAFLARRGNQDFTDIEHLVMTYPNEIRAFANRLDPEALSVLLTYRPRWAPIFGRWTCWTRSGNIFKETWCCGICVSEYAVSLSTEYHVLLLITFGQFFFLRPLPLSLYSVLQADQIVSLSLSCWLSPIWNGVRTTPWNWASIWYLSFCLNLLFCFAEFSCSFMCSR